MEEEKDILQHAGVAHDENPPGRGSGRWPWGSGDKPFQRPKDFLQQVYRLEAMGMSEKDQASSLGIFARDTRRQYEGSPSRLRTAKRIAQHEEKLDIIRQCRTLSAEGVGATEIARRLGLPNESSVRSYLKEGSEARVKSAETTADDLRKIVDEKGPIYVGEGVSNRLNISEDRFKEALEILYFDGYDIHGGRIKQPNNPKHMTTTTVLCPPGTPSSVAYDPAKINFIGDNYISHDGITIEDGFKYPASLDSKRLMVRYPKDGGDLKDGVVELRPGVKDIYLGEGKHYSQVRILVDGTHYIKGMAVYGDEKDFPPGIDLIFNTSKPDGTPLKNPDPKGKQVLKDIGKDPTNPFESSIKEHGGQSYWTDDKGEQHLSLINKREDEGGWDNWSRKLPSQFLSKQPKAFVERQLDISKKDARAELDGINQLTNDNVKKILLEKFANTADSQAVDLYAAAVPGQSYQVILPVNSLKDTEIYAPNYKDGETVSIIRFPHAGLFEIPTLTVNNKNEEGNKIITKNGKDAVGINSNVAKILSGADFDGDTVLVIPHRNGVTVNRKDSLRELKNFDIELEYGDHEGNRLMKKGHEQQLQMGIVSNLITDMTLGGAPDRELAMAVKHSMVVIDAVKHKYDWKQSEKDNHIEELKHKWQKRVNEDGSIHYGGASTIISRASGQYRYRGELKEGEKRIDPATGKAKIFRIDPETGEKLYTLVDEPYRYYTDPVTKERLFPTGKNDMYRTKDGSKIIPKSLAVLSPEKHRYSTVSNMSATKDAMTLVSAGRNPIELAYADYANYLKGLANEARKATLSLKPIQYNPQANKIFAPQVASLNYKYNELEKRKPVEVEAIAEANTMMKGWYTDNPEATKEQRGKANQRILTYCRQKRGLTGSKSSLEITPKEWEAIQAGAISSTKLNNLLSRADLKVIQQYAMPRNNGKLSDAQINRIKSMSAAGHSNSAIAEALNVNVSTVINYLKGDE